MAVTEHEATALILDCRDQGESDLIVTLFCRDLGRLTCIAKGAKRSKKRFVNKLELFSALQTRYRESRTGGLALLTEAELLESFLELRRQTPLYNTATVIRELMLMATKDMEGDDSLFDLVIWALHSLNDGREPTNTLALFFIKFLDRIGYRPHFSTCAACDIAVAPPQIYSFSHSRGAILCASCCGPDLRAAPPVSLGTIKIIQAAQDQPLDRLHRLHFPPAIRREGLQLLQRYTSRLFQREIHSWKFLNLS
ncbi:MAG: DNA repair protein RecO [Desulfobulbaceae bacterium]|uniref:DNA repair protein RecO n=1 Tax=Candidatus Desulfatifera sulfidica TaxID=2841691 RepID=A0A8J6N6K3_9BACT|nr:DNA repair protein RecO [Candidatus Desulfatifera sulfidica]